MEQSIPNIDNNITKNRIISSSRTINTNLFLKFHRFHYIVATIASRMQLRADENNKEPDKVEKSPSKVIADKSTQHFIVIGLATSH